MPVARQNLMRAVYRRYFTLARQALPLCPRGRGRPDEGSAGRLVRLLQPVLRVPALLGVLPYGIDTAESPWPARDHGFGGPGPEVQQRDHRQGPPHRQPLASACPARLEDTLLGLEETSGRHRRRRRATHLDVQGASAAHHAQRRFLRRATCREPDRLRARSSMPPASAGRSPARPAAGNFGMFIGNYEQLRNEIALRIRERPSSWASSASWSANAATRRVAYSFWNTLVGIGAGGAFRPVRHPAAEPNSTVATASPAHLRADLGPDPARPLKFDKGAKNDDRIVTFHDSCNVARASHGRPPGGQFAIPRQHHQGGGQHFHVEMAPARPAKRPSAAAAAAACSPTT